VYAFVPYNIPPY